MQIQDLKIAFRSDISKQVVMVSVCEFIIHKPFYNSTINMVRFLLEDIY